MVPAGVVDKTIADLAPLMEPGDILIDGGNSYYIDDIRRAKELATKEIHYVDVGTSGGVWGSRARVLHDDWRRTRDRKTSRSDLRYAWRRESATFHALLGARSWEAPPSTVTCTAVRMGRATSSRWFTMASSTESWPPMLRD